MTTPSAILFDFDGVLIESEYVGNKHIADLLTAIGHPTSIDQAMANFMGLSGQAFIDALQGWIGGPLPDRYFAERAEEDDRAMAEGVGEVAGAIAFVRSLPETLPRAIVSSSSTRWIRRHLDHIGMRDAFEPHVYSGKEHVTRGKPAPDLYLHAARALGVAIGECVILEDSPVGVRGALASGARVIGLAAGMHCGPDHGESLKALGVREIAQDFPEAARMIFG